MRKAGLIGLGLFLLAASPASAGTIASGHITIGAPTTSLLTTSEAGLNQNIDSFFFNAPAAGIVITTDTVDGGELGYDLDFYFFAASGDYVDSDCQTEAADEVCTVPAGAADAEVAAFFGRELDVDVVTIP
jgi:hypothetical protein